MTGPRRVAAVAIAAAAIVVAAIAVLGALTTRGHPPQSGAPVPAPSGAPSSSSSTTTSVQPRLLPPRTEAIDITGADPCKALTSGQVHQLDYDLGYRSLPMPSTDDIDHGPTCDFSSTRREVGTTIIYSTSNGAEIWLTDPSRNRTNPATAIRIDGFPALQVTNTLVTDECSVVVDNHDGQYVEVFATPDMNRKTPTSSFYCGEAKKVAEMVMRTLSEK